MGFPSFPSISAGLLLIVTAVLSVQPLTDGIRYLIKLFQRLRDRNINSNNSNPRFRLGHEPSARLAQTQQLPAVAQEIRNSLPVTLYEGSNSRSSNGGECAVCLCKFEGGDEIRKLPCNHLFHKNCLDRWLDHEQTTCPLCRASLVPKETADMLRRRQQELTEELMFWFSSFHGHGFNSMWWLRYGCSCDPSTIAGLLT